MSHRFPTWFNYRIRYGLPVAAVLLCVVFFNAPGELLAQDALDSITVTAPSSALEDESPARTGEVIESESSVARTAVPAERLAENAGSVARVLARTAGVQARGAGGFGSTEFLSIRAGTSQQTGVYLDGIRLNGASNPSFDFASLDALGLSSVDVYRGNTPIALGTGDIGGAVNLRTGNAGDHAARFGIQYGSFSSSGLHFGGKANTGPWDILASVGTRQADNDYTVLDDNGTRFNTLDDSIEPRLNSDASRSNLLTRLRYQDQADRSFSLLLQGTQRDSGVPTPRNNPDNRARFGDDTLSLQAVNTAEQLGAWNTRQTLFYNTLNSAYDDRDGTIGLGRQLTDSDARTAGVKLFAERLGENGTLSLVLDVRDEELQHQNRLRGGLDLSARRQEASILSHYALWLPGDRVVVTPALNWRQTRDRVQVSEQAANLRGTPEATNENVFTQGLGVRAELGRGFSLRGNAARVNRSPSFAELFGDSGLLLASPDLESESGTNVDLGIAWAQAHAQHRRFVSLNVFHSRRDDLITTVFDARGVGRAENIAGARVSGVELELNGDITPTISAEANVTWQDTRQVSPFSAFDGRQLPGQAELAATARIDWTRGAWRAWYGLDYERGRFFDTANLLAASDNTLQNAGLAWAQNPWSVSLSLNNLGDVIVEDFRGFPHPGRAIFLSLTLTL